MDPGAFTKQDYLTSDLVYDLREWMENGPEFTLSDYYENLFEAFTIEGHQFTFPLTYAINLAYLNKGPLRPWGLGLLPPGSTLPMGMF